MNFSALGEPNQEKAAYARLKLHTCKTALCQHSSVITHHTTENDHSYEPNK
jgi:hypothetical protein